MEFVCLADRPDAVDRVARWYFDEWARLRPGAGIERVVAKLEDSLNRDRLPLVVIAVDNGEVVAAAELKFREMDIYPEREHWLGGVYVAEEHRGTGMATALVERAARLAEELGVEVLYLQTERADGGLYARLGWQPLEQVTYRGVHVRVMRRRLRSAGDSGR